MGENVLEFKGVTKKYGDNTALNDFSIKLTPGIYGLLGPNGAGKSTMMNLLTDSITRSAGEILYNGTEILKLGAGYRRCIGYMPQQQGMYEQYSAERFLYYIASLKGIRRKEAKEQINKYLTLVGLKNEAGRKLGGYSGGMRQRLMFAATMLGNPDILILDEPTAGLDPEERIKIRNYVSELAENRIVIIATHVVSDIECIASRILLLKKGNLIAADEPSKLLKSISDNIYERVTDYNELKSLMEKYPKGSVTQGRDGIIFKIVEDACPEGFSASDAEPNLEDVYLYYFR